MDDKTKQMLLSAAKAAGIVHDGAGFVSPSGLPINWNPYEYDGDLLGLARNLKIRIDYVDCSVWHAHKTLGWIGEYWGDLCECKNDGQAIVAVAAAIGDAMP